MLCIFNKLIHIDNILNITATFLNKISLHIIMAVDLSKVDKCPECGSENIIYNDKKKQVICKDCNGIFSELTPEQEKQFEKASDVI